MTKKAFPILALAMFSSILGIGIITPLLPIYADSMGATGLWLGVIMASFGTASSISTPVFGRLSDRKGKKIFLCTGLLCYSIISLGYIWAGNVLSLTLVRALQGATGGMTIPIALAYIGDISPKGEEGKWMGYAQAAFFGGFGFGPLMGGTLTEHFGMTVAFSTMGGFNFVAFLIAIIFLPEVKSQKVREGAPRPSFRQMGKNNMVKGIFAFRMTEGVGRAGFMTFLPILAATYIGISLTLIGVLLAIQVLVMAVFSPFGGRIADRLNRKRMVVAGHLLTCLSLALIPLGDTFWLLLTLTILLACGGGLSVPAASALTVEEGRKFGMGSTMAMLQVGMSIGMALGPILCGGVVDLAGVNSAFYLAGVMVLTGAVLFAWFAKRPAKSAYEIQGTE